MEITKNFSIAVYVDPDGLWSEEPSKNVDITESTNNYLELLRETLAKEFATAEIETPYGNSVKDIKIDGMELSYDEIVWLEMKIPDIVHNVYVDFENWLVYRP
jgi:hypothetical protein